MLNSYKTLINGIATAVNSLKAEIKKLSGKVEDVLESVQETINGLDIPVEDDLTIVRDANGKLSTSLGAYERNIDITWDGDTTGLKSFILSWKYTNEDGKTDRVKIPYYRLSDKVLTEDDIWASIMVHTSFAEDIKTDFTTETWGTGIFKGNGCFAVYNLLFAMWGMPAIVVATEKHASWSYSTTSNQGTTTTVSISDIPHKGTYFARFLASGETLIFVKELTARRLKTIDKKFLPAAEGETMVVNISGSGTKDDPYVADMTYDNVYEGYKNGANIIMFYGGFAGHLLHANTGSMQFVSLDVWEKNKYPPWPQIRVFNWQNSGNELTFYTRKIFDPDYVSASIYDVSNYDTYYVPTVQAVRNAFDDLKANFVLNSSTEGSDKKFKITVDDEGTISATEVTS